MRIITSEKMHIAVNWIERITLRKHPKFRVYLRALTRVSNNYKQIN